MWSPILLIFVIAQAVSLAATGGDRLTEMQGPELFAWSTILIGIFFVGWVGDYLSRLAFPNLRPLSTLKVFLIAQWITCLLSNNFNIWIDQVLSQPQGFQFVAALTAVLGLVTSEVVILITLVAVLVLSVELPVRWVLLGARPQLLMSLRPLIVLFAVAAMSRVIGEFSLLIIQ